MRHGLAAIAFVIAWLFLADARAETWEAPVGGKALALGDGRVACAGTAGDWAIEQEGHAVRPPTRDDAVGGAVDVKVSPSPAACPTSGSTLTLVTTGRWPVVEGTTLFVDDARVEIAGHGLRGVRVEWCMGDRGGDDRCVQPQTDASGERCSVSVGHGLRADPAADTLHWWPAGARAGAAATLFDASGRRISAEERALYPSRIVVSSLVAPDVSIDLAGGTASRIPLVHPEAVAGADCGAAICDVSGGAIVVGGLTSVSSALAVRLRLAPRVVLRHGDAFEPAPLVSVPVLPCAMAIASGEALRSVDATRAVVRVDARCASEVGGFRWFSTGRMLDALGTAQAGGATYVLLAVGRVEGEELVISAARSAADGSTVGQARVRSRPAPLPRATLAIDDDEAVDFVPTNRPATVQGLGRRAMASSR